LSEIRPAARQTEDRSRLSGRFSCPAEGDCGLAFAVPLSADVGEGSAVAGHPLEWYVGAAKGEHDGPSSAATPGQRRETGHLRLPQAVWAYGRASGHLALAREMEATWRRAWRGPESARTHSGTGPESADTSCSTSAKLPRNGAATRNAEDHFQLKRAAACAACEDLRRDREARWRAGTGCQAERVALLSPKKLNRFTGISRFVARPEIGKFRGVRPDQQPYPLPISGKSDLPSER
jgi:hypothetical protein